MLEKGKDGRLKRIEYRGKYLRASRTGGMALRAQTKLTGINLTANSNHGLRASVRVAKGTQVAFQNGRFILRGRYGKGSTKLNLSKSGVSVSTKTNVGTINWFKPRYSSAKIGGIQVRGKNALYLHLLIGLIQLSIKLIILLAHLSILTAQIVQWLVFTLLKLVQRAWGMRHSKAILAAESVWLEPLSNRDADWLQEALQWIFLHLGQGGMWSCQQQARNEMQDTLASLISATRLPDPLNLEVLFGCLAECYEKNAGEESALELFLDLDSTAVATGGRNLLQERLLAAYAGCCGIDLDETAENDTEPV
jgi:hypothetical protein